MGSSQQIIVGILLLVSAFVVGRYVHNKPISLGETELLASRLQESNAKFNDASPEVPDSVFLQKSKSPFATGEKTAKSKDSLQKSLRERILGSRRVTPNSGFETSETFQTIPQSVFKPETDFDAARLRTSSLPQRETIKPVNAVVEPDFSHLESLAESLPQPEFNTPYDDSVDREIEAVMMEPEISHSSQYSQTALNPPRSDLSTYDRRSRRTEWIPSETLRPEPAESISIRTPRRYMPEPTAPTAPAVSPATQGQQTWPIRRSADLQPKLKANAQLSKVLSRDQHLPAEAKDYLSYTCKRNDTLHSISKKYYGVSNYYLDIYIHNRDVMKNPADIYAGQELKIPVYSE